MTHRGSIDNVLVATHCLDPRLALEVRMLQLGGVAEEGRSIPWSSSLHLPALLSREGCGKMSPPPCSQCSAAHEHPFPLQAPRPRPHKSQGEYEADQPTQSPSNGQCGSQPLPVTIPKTETTEAGGTGIHLTMGVGLKTGPSF